MGEAGAIPSDEKQADSGSSPIEESVIWSQEVEVCLFHAMLGHKPVGVNRHFHMICIRDKFSQNIGRQVPSKVIWDHLATMYDMQALVRVNRHFHMICIRDKFSQNIGRQVPSKVIWDHLATMYDMQALHESEILPFPNSEKSFVLPDDIIQEVKEGKVGIEEEETREEIKEEVEQPALVEEGSNCSVKLAEKASSKEKEKDREKGSSENAAKEAADKRKRNRVTEKVLNANSNPSSPSGAKRRRT
ncbi:UNVERIFIED_CONTAM: hypothetical protein FKN15_058865 [Acipenser sinensis]